MQILKGDQHWKALEYEEAMQSYFDAFEPLLIIQKQYHDEEAIGYF